MWLLSAAAFELKEFQGTEAPPYVILSHMWGPPGEEVSFQDIKDLDKAQEKNGFEKIQGCCRQARLDRFEWVWIDTCCIDKSSSSELSEAINSMYDLYKNAHICYAYLDDVLSSPTLILQAPFNFTISRYFTRGWTLQELIAPEAVVFFNILWEPIGTKGSLTSQLKEITGIPEYILSGASPRNHCVADVMSWAWNRRTTRVEDTAYSLLGLFNINMPLLYGEGSKAFLRLQEEVLRTTGDYSIFAWTDPSPLMDNIFAKSPRSFTKTSEAWFTRSRFDEMISVKPPIVWGNVLRLSMRTGPECADGYRPAYLNCQQKDRLVCIMVKQKSVDENSVWCRNGKLFTEDPQLLSSFELKELHFEIDIKSTPPNVYRDRYTHFILENHPPCISNPRTGKHNISTVIRSIKGEDLHTLVHEPGDYSCSTVMLLSHDAHTEMDSRRNLGNRHLFMGTDIHEELSNGFVQAQSHVRNQYPELSDLARHEGVIELTLGTRGLHSRIPWVKMSYQIGDEFEDQLADQFQEQFQDWLPYHLASSDSDHQALLLPGPKVGTGVQPSTQFRLLTVSVKPTGQSTFSVSLKCSGHDLLGEIRDLRASLQSPIQKIRLSTPVTKPYNAADFL